MVCNTIVKAVTYKLLSTCNWNWCYLCLENKVNPFSLLAIFNQYNPSLIVTNERPDGPGVNGAEVVEAIHVGVVAQNKADELCKAK